MSALDADTTDKGYLSTLKDNINPTGKKTGSGSGSGSGVGSEVGVRGEKRNWLGLRPGSGLGLGLGGRGSLSLGVLKRRMSFQSIATSNDEDDDMEEDDVVGGGGGGGSRSGGGGRSGINGNVNDDDVDNDDDDDDDGEMVMVLENISLSIPTGSLTAICGSTGSGKSTLLSGILGECKQLGGKTDVQGKVSFVAQSAW